MGCCSSSHVTAVDPPEKPNIKAVDPPTDVKMREQEERKSSDHVRPPQAAPNPMQQALMSQLKSSVVLSEKLEAADQHAVDAPPVKRTHTPGGTPLEGMAKGAQKGDRVCFLDKNKCVQRGDVVRRVEQRVRVRDDLGGLSGWVNVRDLLPLSAYIEEDAHGDDLPPPPEAMGAASMVEIARQLSEVHVAVVEEEEDVEDAIATGDVPSADDERSAQVVAEAEAELEAEAAADAAAAKLGPRGLVGLDWGEASDSDEALDELGVVSVALTDEAAVLAKFTVASVDESEGGHFALDVDGSGVLARGRLSPRGPVTQPMVYATMVGAATFAVIYPASSVPSTDPQSEWALPHNDVVPLLQHGGWVFWDADERVLGLRAFAAATAWTTPLRFGEKMLRFGPRVADGLGGVRFALAGVRHRLQPVTIPALKRCGIKYFTWINPAESIGDADGGRCWPHGAFAYFYSTPEQGLDCYFAVTERLSEEERILTDGPPPMPPPVPPALAALPPPAAAPPTASVAPIASVAPTASVASPAEVASPAPPTVLAVAPTAASEDDGPPPPMPTPKKVRAQTSNQVEINEDRRLAALDSATKDRPGRESRRSVAQAAAAASPPPPVAPSLLRQISSGLGLTTLEPPPEEQVTEVAVADVPLPPPGILRQISSGIAQTALATGGAIVSGGTAVVSGGTAIFSGVASAVGVVERRRSSVERWRFRAKGLSCLFDEFVNGRELSISAHLHRFDALLGSLLLAAGNTNRTMSDLVKAHYAASDRVSTDTFKYLNSGRNRQKLPFSAHALLDGLNTRRETYANKGYTSGTPLRVLVLGGGPMGLYAACELALLGHTVSVYECRDETCRLNVLKLWPETERALNKHLCLNRFDHQFANGSARASTTRLQQSLLKAALMLGVHVTLRPSSKFSLADADGFDALVNAAGHRHDILETFAREATVSRALHSNLASARTEPFATRGMKITCATAIVAHFEFGDRTPATKAWSDGLKGFDWAWHDAKLGDTDPAALVARHGAWAVAPKVVASSLRAQLPLDAQTEALLPTMTPRGAPIERPANITDDAMAPLENVICIKNQANNKVVSSGRTELANLHGPPPSFYWIATLRPRFVEAVVARMVGATARARGVAPQPLPSPPMGASGNAVPLVQWAYEQSQARSGLVSSEEYRKEINAVADAIATVFTNPYLEHGLEVTRSQVEKPTAPFAHACRLLREAAHDASASTAAGSGSGGGGGSGGGYPDKQWEKTAQVFDFSESKRMASAAEVITHINGRPRPKPLLLCFAGDALQEPFWPEGLGINRGAHNAQDSAWAVNQWRHATTDDERAAVVAERQACYDKFTCPMSGKNRKALRGHDPSSGNPLEGKERLFKSATVDPCTRYNADRFGFRPLRLKD